jgi:hypothetical protein
VVLAQGLCDERVLLSPTLPMNRSTSRLVVLNEDAGIFELTRGNLIEADVEAMINTANTEGIMGKGIALQFRKAYPENYKAYRRLVRLAKSSLGAYSCSTAIRSPLHATSSTFRPSGTAA